MQFVFDPDKASANLRKHGIAFPDVEPVFYDQSALTQEDGDSQGEPRFITVGMDALERIVAVCWTEREHAIRLISARPATPNERKQYEKGI